MKASKRTGRPRAPAMDRLTANTYVGTREVVDALIKDSSWHPPAWRPVRAAAARALGLREAEGHIWMTAEEFGRWLETYTPGKRGEPLRQVGIARSRRAAILDERMPIKAIEALAIAHYRAGLPVPCELAPEAFEAWFTPRFGYAAAVANVLGVNGRLITEQMRGFAVTSAGRAQRLPDITLVRALDWVWRVGPISPYGATPPGAAYPGQLEGGR